MAALTLLSDESTTFDRAQSALDLIGGISPYLDKKLQKTKESLLVVKNLSEGDFLDFGILSIPAKGEKEKKRKKPCLPYTGCGRICDQRLRELNPRSLQRYVQLKSSPSSQSQAIKYIVYDGNKIALSELSLREGNDCDSPHYHAANGTNVVTFGGVTINDSVLALLANFRMLRYSASRYLLIHGEELLSVRVWLPL